MCHEKYGIISYNHYVNFVNFGSILQTYALQQALDQLHVDNVIVDYTPKSMMWLVIDGITSPCAIASPMGS